MSLFKVLSLPGSPELPRCTRVLVWGRHEPWTGAMRVGVGRSGAGIKGREDMIHGGVGSSRETAADLQSEGRWTGTKALFRQSECSVSCDGWRRSVWKPLSRCVSRSHLQASTVNRDQMADARGPSGTCALRHTNDYGCRPINGHICKGEQQPAHWEWVSSFNSPLEHRHAGVNVGIKTQNAAIPSVQVQVGTSALLRLHLRKRRGSPPSSSADFRKFTCWTWKPTITWAGFPGRNRRASWNKKKKNARLQLNAKLSNEFINLKTALNIHSKSIGNKLNITHWLII